MKAYLEPGFERSTRRLVREVRQTNRNERKRMAMVIEFPDRRKDADVDAVDDLLQWAEERGIIETVPATIKNPLGREEADEVYQLTELGKTFIQALEILDRDGKPYVGGVA